MHALSTSQASPGPSAGHRAARLRLQLAALLPGLALSGALAATGIALGHIGLSWDALNHHIYLGWTAEQPRFDRDYLAALYQGYLFPYLYWPAYKLAVGGASYITVFVGLMGVLLAIALFQSPFQKFASVCLGRWNAPDPFLPEELRSPGQSGWYWLREKLCLSLGVSTASTLGSMPLMIGYFNLLTPVGILANAGAP